MPLIKQKTSRAQRVREKSEIEDLFSRLDHCYAPFLSPSFLPPFPLQLIAQARAWRGHHIPIRKELVVAIQGIDAARGIPVRNTYRVKGESAVPGIVIDVEKESESWFTLDDGTIAIRAGWLGMVLVLSETLFRVLRVLELELEPLVSEILLSRGLSADRSRAEFGRMWEERKNAESMGWVLAAGKIPLGIGGRPPILAPQIAAAAVAARMQQERVGEMQVLTSTASLATVLLNCVVRPEEIRHWRDIFYRVKVASNSGNIPLPRYLSCELAEDRRLQGLMESSTPSTLLKLLEPPITTCVDLARLVPQVQRERDPKPGEAKERSSRTKKSLQKDWLFRCRQCNSSEMQKEEIWPHLQSHAIREEEIDLDLELKIVYRQGTREVLATLREIRI